jgi:hypothetical protein
MLDKHLTTVKHSGKELLTVNVLVLLLVEFILVNILGKYADRHSMDLRGLEFNAVSERVAAEYAGLFFIDLSQPPQPRI